MLVKPWIYDMQLCKLPIFCPSHPWDWPAWRRVGMLGKVAWWAFNVVSMAGKVWLGSLPPSKWSKQPFYLKCGLRSQVCYRKPAQQGETRPHAMCSSARSLVLPESLCNGLDWEILILAALCMLQVPGMLLRDRMDATQVMCTHTALGSELLLLFALVWFCCQMTDSFLPSSQTWSHRVIWLPESSFLELAGSTGHSLDRLDLLFLKQSTMLLCAGFLDCPGWVLFDKASLIFFSFMELWRKRSLSSVTQSLALSLCKTGLWP